MFVVDGAVYFRDETGDFVVRSHCKISFFFSLTANFEEELYLTYFSSVFLHF